MVDLCIIPPLSCPTTPEAKHQKIETLAQILAAIAIFLVPAFRARSMKPLRGFVFSFMASAAFYPIIAACFLHGYRVMDREAGATRYVLTVLTYLLAVTIYVVRLCPRLLIFYFHFCFV